MQATQVVPPHIEKVISQRILKCKQVDQVEEA
jgi:hypothetical protein